MCFPDSLETVPIYPSIGPLYLPFYLVLHCSLSLTLSHHQAGWKEAAAPFTSPARNWNNGRQFVTWGPEGGGGACILSFLIAGHSRFPPAGHWTFSLMDTQLNYSWTLGFSNCMTPEILTSWTLNFLIAGHYRLSPVGHWTLSLLDTIGSLQLDIEPSHCWTPEMLTCWSPSKFLNAGHQKILTS